MSKHIWQVFQRSYQIEADLIGVKEFPPLKRTIVDLQSSSNDFYGYFKKEVLTAVIEIDQKEEELEICSLVVDPNYFRQGIAGQLIDFVLKTFNPKRSTVETALVNIPAISLYKSKGFVEESYWMTSFQIEKIKLNRRQLSN